MKVHVLCANGYNYEKDGQRKSGVSFHVCSIIEESNSDGAGNFTFGTPCEKVFIPRTLYNNPNDLINFVGKDVELVYERKLGQRFDTLVDIKPI